MALPTTPKKFSEAPAASAMDSPDEFLILQSGQVRRADHSLGQGPIGATGDEGPLNSLVNLGFSVDGKPTASFDFANRYLFAQSFIFAASLVGSFGLARVAATAQADFDLRVNGVSKATVRFEASQTQAGFILASSLQVNANDYIELIAPNSPDATLEDVSITLSATRVALQDAALDASLLAPIAENSITARTLAARWGDILNVKDGYGGVPGAKGDGVTDDTAAIIGLKDQVKATGKIGFFPPGTYLCDFVDWGFILGAEGKYYIIGSGIGSTTIKKKTADGNQLWQIGRSDAFSFETGFFMSGLNLEGIAGDTPEVFTALSQTKTHITDCRFKSGLIGAAFYNCITNKWERCDFQSSGTGCVVDQKEIGGTFVSANLNIFDNCLFSLNTGWGLDINKFHMLELDTCQIENNGVNGVLTSGGLHVGPDFAFPPGGRVPPGVLCVNTWFEQNDGKGPVHQESHPCTYMHCNFTNNPVPDFTVDGGTYTIIGTTMAPNKSPGNIVENSGSRKGSVIIASEITNTSAIDPTKTSLVATLENVTGPILQTQILGHDLIGSHNPTPSDLPVAEWGEATGGTATEVVTFATAFKVAPDVILTVAANDASNILQAEAFSITTAGFTLRRKQSDATTISAGTFNVKWFAIGSGVSK